MGCARGVKVKLPSAAIGGVGAALDQSGVAQTVDHPRQGDRFNFDQFGKRALPNSLIATQIHQHPPLQRRDPAIADTCVEVAAKQPRGIIEQESDRL